MVYAMGVKMREVGVEEDVVVLEEWGRGGEGVREGDVVVGWVEEEEWVVMEVAEVGGGEDGVDGFVVGWVGVRVEGEWGVGEDGPDE
ncbi:hypothetical protein, partial [Prescottella equi]|uniref:hypothetical protein n=1 Tax=Rhodococcus hoagii TaxID=43767 RepID=UPI0016428D8E